MYIFIKRKTSKLFYSTPPMTFFFLSFFLSFLLIFFRNLITLTCPFPVAITRHPPLDGAIAPRLCTSLRIGKATIGRVAHILHAVTWGNTRVCFNCLVSDSTQLIKLLLHSRWDAVHLFNSIHHKEPWRYDCTKRKRRGVWKGESMGAVKKNKQKTDWSWSN